MRTATMTTTLRWAVVGVLGIALVAAPGIASAWTKGNTPPSRLLDGPHTKINGPYSVAFDAQGRMYVANAMSNSVEMYAANWANGDTAPRKSLVGPATGLNQPTSIAFDAAGNMYVANSTTGSPSVTVYAPEWAKGNTAPIKTLSGPSTGLSAPVGLAFDATGKMYVADFSGNVILVFAADWASGDRAPVKHLGGPNSGVNGPTSIAWDAAGRMHVTNVLANTVTAYPADWASGDMPPVKVLSGPATGLSAPVDVDFDYLGRMNVLSVGTLQCNYETVSSLAVWPGEWTAGNTAPSKELKGSNTKLVCPTSMAFGPSGETFVANSLGNDITGYAADVTVTIKGKRTSPTAISLAGVTSGVPLGASITAYVRMKAPKQKFVPQHAIKLTKGDLAKGTFTYPIGKLKAGKAYEVYVVIGSAKSATITVAP